MLHDALYLDGRNQPFYTVAKPISSIMGQLLGSVRGKRVLEPSVGRGAFLGHLIGQPAQLDAVDVDPEALDFLDAQGLHYVRLVRADFIKLSLESDLFSGAALRCDYDAVISNPPYGLRFSHEFRRELKARLGRFYVRESYGLFLRFAIERLANGGRYVFIVPDTFLTSNNHRPLRQFLADIAPPSELILFDSRRFESVQFGYGSFCIVAGNRGQQQKEVTWLDLRLNHEAELHWPHAFSEAEEQTELQIFAESGWVPPRLRKASKSEDSRQLASIADCRTGIYTGDNIRFLGYDPLRATRRVNGHPINWAKDVIMRDLTPLERARGISAGPSYVPLVRGGHRKPHEKPEWAIDWSVKAVEFYRTDKKARYQNAQFYFQSGLAIPMVTSGRISASIMSGAVFDQGVVGVFPHDERLLNFLLLFLNSQLATDMKRAINPSANNSARYIGRLEVPSATNEAVSAADVLVEKLRASERLEVAAAANAYFADMITSENISPLHHER